MYEGREGGSAGRHGGSSSRFDCAPARDGLLQNYLIYVCMY